ncbi:MAG TPA: YihY/virulence factor BrkB family protein [Candidatus Limnocylindrales bacterium]|nr:YihY/virulence factor BrkB family protein [Candidatus Limnocylindrales bacterium]
MQTPPTLGFAKRLITQVMDDEVPDVAAGLAYRFLFAFFPFAIFLAALAAFVAPALGMGDPTNEILGGVSDNLPPDVAEQIRPQLEAVLGTTRPGLLSIGAALALWAATGGVGAVIKGMNKAYDVEETRGFVRRTAVALGLTILGSIGILTAFVTIVGGSAITEGMVAALGIGEGAWAAISIMRYPLVLVLVTIAVAVLFKLGPNVRVSFRWTLAGGTLFAVLWLLGTVLFGLYVANFGNYANTYGALGGVVVLMLWLYLTGLALLVAAEVTALLAREREPQVLDARRKVLADHTARRGLRVAGAAMATANAEAATAEATKVGRPRAGDRRRA